MIETCTPSLTGSSGQDSPSLTGWGIAVTSGQQEIVVTGNKTPLYERLRRSCEPAKLDDYGVPSEARKAFYQAMGEWIYGGEYGFYLEPDTEGHCDSDAFVEVIARRFHELATAYNGNPTQSPIEDMLLGSLLWLESDWAGFPTYDFCGDGPNAPHYAKADRKPLEMHFVLTSQAPVAGYKVDFLLWVTCGKEQGGVAIECDGHAFHEKTKEQAARDKKRDREILAAGYPVMRFSGSEVYKDTRGCVDQIAGVFSEVLHRVSKAGGLFSA